MSFGDGIDWGFEARRAAAADDTAQAKPPNIEWVQPLVDRLPQKGSVLDAGCNIGRYCPAVLAAGFQYVGVDQSEDALSIARARNPRGKFISAFLWDMQFDTPFDVVLSFAVLQHNTLEEKLRILPRIAGALRSGGYFLMKESTVPEETATQLTQARWISLVQSVGFELVSLWHPNPSFGIEDHYLFRRT